MIKKFRNSTKFDKSFDFSQLKPGQVKSSINIDIGRDILKELFSSGDDPFVRIKACDSCNQGGCLDCIRGYVALGVGTEDEFIEFDRKAADIIARGDLPIRITYESIYDKSSIKPGEDAKPINRQVYIEMDSRLKQYVHNELKEVETIKGGPSKFEILM
ncbi:hypothetical protein ACFL9T_19395 [Thermodesulfobacteriota bacterium]